MNIRYLLTILSLSTILSACGSGSYCPVANEELEAHRAIIKQVNTPDAPNDIENTVNFSSGIEATNFMIEVKRKIKTSSANLSFFKKINISLFNNAYACALPIYGVEFFTNIEIISDNDFSEEYPAGTNLKDLFIVEYFHEYDTFNPTTDSQSGVSFDQLIEQRVNLMDHMQAKLLEGPSKSKKHKFTMTINTYSFLLESVTFK